MVEYTYQQKIAMMRILLDIIHADGRIDARETFFFEQLKDKYGLNEEDHEVVNSKNSLLALSQLKEMSEEQKEDFAKQMSRMIIVDEDINVNEVSIYNIVVDSCGIPSCFEDYLKKEDLDSCTTSSISDFSNS